MSGLAKSSVLLLLDELNRKNDNVAALSDLVFGVPEATTELGRNTKIRIDSSIGGNFSGTREVWYNRLDLAEVFVHLNTVHVGLGEENLTSYLDVLHHLNEKFKLNIQDDEVLPAEIVANRMLLTIAPGSLAFYGQINIALGVNSDIPLYDLIINTTLDGLWYPDAIIGHLVFPETIVGTLLSNGVKLDTRLQFGAGQSAEHMVIATNNEIEVAVRVNTIGKPPLSMVDGEYSLSVNDGEHVEFVFSIVLLDTTINNKIEELYDISFYLNCKDTPATFIATLAKGSNGVFHFVADDRTTEVSNVSQFLNGTVIQTIQSIENFPTILDGGIAGVYEVGLVAYRRNSIVPRLEAVANFNVTVNSGGGV